MIVETVQSQEDGKSLAVSTLSVDLLNDFFAYLDVAPKTLQVCPISTPIDPKPTITTVSKTSSTSRNY